jgi:hypothetical protein
MAIFPAYPAVFVCDPLKINKLVVDVPFAWYSFRPEKPAGMPASFNNL